MPDPPALRMLPMNRLLLLTLLAFAPLPAGALLLDAGNGNTSAPADDPGWANIGELSQENAVYLGYGWGLTAAHVSTAAPATFDGIEYPIEPRTAFILSHDGVRDADLKVFRMDPWPEHLPVLPIRETAVAANATVTLIGTGRDRGAALPGGNGWWWASSSAKRWGTNRVILASWQPPPIGAWTTRAILMDFDRLGTPDECMATTGDSGGGLFVKRGGVWELAGIQFAVFQQRWGAASYGDSVLSADLAFYREQLLDIVRPCDDGRDNDSDGNVDWPDDPGCRWAGDRSEAFECADGIDNDLDYLPDLLDPDCDAAIDDLEAPDTDDDLVADAEDNCLEVTNPDQLDANQDGYGNLCDPDFTNDGIVGSPDYRILSDAWGSQSGGSRYDPAVDLNGDGVIGFLDLSIGATRYLKTPGPSGLACAGTVPCP